MTLSQSLSERAQKGALKSIAYYQEVYTWDGTSSVYQKRSLLIRVTDGRVKIYVDRCSCHRTQPVSIGSYAGTTLFVESAFLEKQARYGYE
jgi:hypothetical protein